MNPLSRFEKLAEQLVEGAFGRWFAGQLHPLEVALQLARAMEDAQVLNLRGERLAPNHYWVYLNPADYDALRGFFDDRLHQPYREKLVPQLTAVIRAGEAAGAIGGFLSGSGSAIICLTLRNPRGIAAAMQREIPESTMLILKADAHGARVRMPSP